MTRREFLISLGATFFGALLKRHRPRTNVNLVLLQSPEQIDIESFSRASEQIGKIFQSAGIRIYVRRRVMPHPDLELNTYWKRFDFLRKLREIAECRRWTSDRVTHFLALPQELDFGILTYGQSQLGVSRPKVSFSSTDENIYVMAITACHEIGHALNAQHDESSHNIMSTQAIGYALAGESLTFNEEARYAMRACIRKTQGRNDGKDRDRE